ncbi:O-antigen ligase family protein [Eudoraea chungangensis]|uniref:O-antigen ligase family protein n=1 Tax=Eudoraea chungangensis TaxID=1481905 RepID=UPI0023ED1AAD|nr:O-antigen ligase family protein [Eudoraea chungangensis]
MKTLSVPKASLVLLLGTIPLNFIVLGGIGNVYLSTMTIFILFILMSLMLPVRLFNRTSSLIAIFLVGFFILTTTINFVLDGGNLFKDQLVFTIIHLQLVLVFILSYYIMGRITFQELYQVFLIVVFIFTLRVFIDDSSRVFSFSSVRGERIEALYAGGVNNFALLAGTALIISFFSITRKYLKLISCLYFLFIILLTMSRGALLGVIFTLFITALYDVNRKTLIGLLNISFVLTLLGMVFLLTFDQGQEILDQIQKRFLGYFTGELSLEQASSGREIIIRDIYVNHIKDSSLYEMVFGHGMGSINFKVNGSPYESSHNILVDIFYRNGLLILIMYLMLIGYLFFRFLKRRGKEDLALFGVFIFLHFEILVNPFIYAAQTGWIYAFFLAAFFRSNLLSINSTKANAG